MSLPAPVLFGVLTSREDHVGARSETIWLGSGPLPPSTSAFAGIGPSARYVTASPSSAASVTPLPSSLIAYGSAPPSFGGETSSHARPSGRTPRLAAIEKGCSAPTAADPSGLSATTRKSYAPGAMLGSWASTGRSPKPAPIARGAVEAQPVGQADAPYSKCTVVGAPSASTFALKMIAPPPAHS